MASNVLACRSLAPTIALKGVVSKPRPARHSKYVTRCDLSHAAAEASRIIGTGFGAFVMFNCTLNWLHYRGIRKEREFKKKEKDDSADN
jgi:hypothetical protein